MCQKIEEAGRRVPNLYVKRELLTHSIEGKRVELLTISSQSNKLEEKEEIIPHLFPEHFCNIEHRPQKFTKPVIFLS
jgi:hypothetical protein